MSARTGDPVKTIVPKFYMARRKIGSEIQETRYRGGSCRTIKGKDTRYKLYWSGNDKGTAGVGVFVAEEWIEKFLRFRESPTELF